MSTKFDKKLEKYVIKVMLEQYKTISSSEWIKVVVQKSKFFGRAFSITNSKEITNTLKKVEEQYKKPSHIVYAYRLLHEDTIEDYATDAGEPTHSSGPPVLKVLQGEELMNVLLIVVRYFGGIKLGIGGLIKAYTLAAQEALQHSSIITKINYKKMILQTTYKELGELLYSIEKHQGKVVQILHGQNPTIHALIPMSFAARFLRNQKD